MQKTERIVKVLDILRKEQARTMLGDMSRRYDPFKILISTILSARSKDEVTYPICERLFEKYPNAETLANAKKEDVARIIRQIGFYNQKAGYIIETAKRVVNDFKGRVPQDYERLMGLPGVGRKVAGCVLVYAFGISAIPIDTHCHRVSNRLGLVKTSTPEQTEIELMNIVPKRLWMIVNDTFVYHGKNICNPISPKCSICPINSLCPKRGVEKRR